MVRFCYTKIVICILIAVNKKITFQLNSQRRVLLVYPPELFSQLPE